MKEESIKWSLCVGVRTDADRVVAGNEERLRASNKPAAAEAVWTHSV
jgi:hypothetical protein